MTKNKRFAEISSSQAFFFVLVLSILVCCSCGTSHISQEQAISAAKDFVNSQVKFYSEEESGSDSNITDINQVEINIVEAFKDQDEWIIILHIRSTSEDEEKKRGLSIVIDAKTGEIIREKTKPFEI